MHIFVWEKPCTKKKEETEKTYGQNFSWDYINPDL